MWHGLAVVVAAYVAVTLTYSLRLKHEPVLEAFLPGARLPAARDRRRRRYRIAISSWFLIVAAFGSLFMAAGKRASELDYALEQRGGDTAGTRKVLTGYTPAYLRFVWGLAATVTVTAYCLWAFEGGRGTHSSSWAKISIIPFVLAILRYAVDIDSGRAGAPDRSSCQTGRSC